MTEPIKIKGGAHKWIDTKDGYKTILDVPLVAAFPKGTKGIQWEGDEENLKELVTSAQDRYNKGNFCATVFKGHNQELPLTHPDFSGYALPTRVGMAMTQHGEKMTVFGNLKITDAKFEEAKAGKLPYVSPEIKKFAKKMSGVALLDTEPPQNEFALMTIGEEVKDDAAKFAASPDTREDRNFERDYPEAHQMLKGISDSISKLAAKPQAIDDPLVTKPNPLPAEPGDKEAKMAMDPELAAKFSALTAENADIKQRLEKQDAEKCATRLNDKAKVALSAKIVPPALEAQIAQFSAEWSGVKDGEARLDKYIEALKPSLKDKPTNDDAGAHFEANPSDPLVAEFAKDGADPKDVARFGALYDEQLRLSKGYLTCPKKDFIKNQLLIAKSGKNGTANFDSRR